VQAVAGFFEVKALRIGNRVIVFDQQQVFVHRGPGRRK
jgi:hypothetical protein